MTLDEGKIDQAVLALLYLGLHDGALAWKGFDWEAMNRLYEKGFIADPRGKAKSVVFTEAGLDEAKRLLEQSYSSESTQRLWIMVAGPYRSGSSEPAVWAESSKTQFVSKGDLPKRSCADYRSEHGPAGHRDSWARILRKDHDAFVAALDRAVRCRSEN